MTDVLRILVAIGSLAGAGILANHHLHDLGAPISRRAIHHLNTNHHREDHQP